MSDKLHIRADMGTLPLLNLRRDKCAEALFDIAGLWDTVPMEDREYVYPEFKKSFSILQELLVNMQRILDTEHK